jgi:hypothetical protein
VARFACRTAKHRSSDRRSCDYEPGSGFHLLSSSGTCPFRPEVALPAPLRRRRCGSTGADRLQLLGPACVTLVLALWLRSPRRDRRAAAGDPHRASWRSGDLPASPSAPPLRCPVRSRLVPFRSRLGPSLGSLLARGRGSFASHGTRLRCLGPKTVGGPPAGRSRRRGLGGSPSPVQGHGTALDRVVKERGETVEASASR